MDALNTNKIETLRSRREKITREFFCEIKKPAHILNELLMKRDFSINLRNQYDFEIPRVRTLLCRSDFIIYCLCKNY